MNLIELSLKDGLIGILSLAFLVCLFLLLRMQMALKKERQRRILPLLKLTVDTDHVAMKLKNTSQCCAKNIVIEEQKFTLDETFKKALTLKFEPIDYLNPGDETDVQFQIYDGTHPLPSLRPENLIVHLSAASFELLLRYTNIENMPFQEIILKEKERIIIKEARPLD